MERGASHPGEHLADAIEAVGGLAARVARDFGAPLDWIADIPRCNRVITADMAERLGSYFRVGAALWMNLQRTSDLRVAASGQPLLALARRRVLG